MEKQKASCHETVQCIGQTSWHLAHLTFGIAGCLSGSPGEVPGSAASASPGNVLAMQVLEPCPRHTESETGLGSATWALTNPPGVLLHAVWETPAHTVVSSPAAGSSCARGECLHRKTLKPREREGTVEKLHLSTLCGCPATSSVGQGAAFCIFHKFRPLHPHL